MPKIAYIQKRFNRHTTDIIVKANAIIAEYVAQGFELTLRSLYYKFIGRDLFPETWIDKEYNIKKGLDPQTKNTVKNYKRLGSILNDARLAGLMDWESFDDITRKVRSMSHWSTPSDIINSCAHSFRIDKWEGQKFRPEVWVEKDALAGVVTGICQELDIPFLCCRGYTSQTEMWGSAMRLKAIYEGGQTPFILHFGDHDPSGIDMSRDIQERLEIFQVEPDFRRLALNMAQIKTHKCPPNPAKESDSRFKSYADKFGDDSWELDALEPQVIVDLIKSHVLEVRDDDLWDEKVAEESQYRSELRYAADNWELIETAMKKRRRRGK